MTKMFRKNHTPGGGRKGQKSAGAAPAAESRAHKQAPRLHAVSSVKKKGAAAAQAKPLKDKSEQGGAIPIHQDVIKRFSKEKALELHQKLVKKKAEVQNRPHLSKQALSSLGTERGMDQADLMSRLQAETQYTVQIQRDSSLISQILKALAKMQSGKYGICEQTGEVIEIERLDSIPWTPLSIEGAEELENRDPWRKAR